MQPQQQPYQQPPQPQVVPQSPMQPMQPRKKRGLSEYMNWAIIAFAVILTLCLGVWAVIVLLGKTSSDTGKTQLGAATVLEPESVAPKTRTINSKLGVQVPYNMRELEGFGFADDVTFSGTDLDESRGYTVVRVRPVETSEATRSNMSLESPELRVTSSVNKNYWDSLATKKEYKDLSKIDMLVKETITARKADKTVESSDAEVKKINNIDYRKVSFVAKSERFGVATERREDCYMTIQNSDRPYVACINGIRDANFAVVPQLEKVLSGMTYDNLDKSALSATASAAAKTDAKMLDAKQDEKVAGRELKKSADEKDAKISKDTSASTSKEKSAASKEDASDDEEKTSDEKSDSKPMQPSSKISDYLTDTANFRTMAVATPATVRVGTIYCADIKLTLPTTGGAGPTLTGACVNKAGTGFFVSGQGVIATSASSVQVKPQDAITAYIVNAASADQAAQRLQRVLDYMVEGRIIMQTDADALIAGVDEQDPEAIAKVNALSTRIASEDIAISKESYKYAVQLADKPIVVSQNGDGSESFAYTDVVAEAKLEDKAYDTSKTQQQIYGGDTVASDTALLRVKKDGTYPVLPLALSGEGVADESVVNFVGAPMYAVGSLATAQFRSSPMFRAGKVTQTLSGDKGQRVRIVDTTSHAGLAGAPVLGADAHVVGMATYGNLNCPESKCFSSTVIRDTTGITEIAKRRNLVLQTTSQASDVWRSAIDQLVRGNYREATGLFNQASKLYPQNYLAAEFAAYSKKQYGSATDTSTMNSLVGVLQAFALLSFGLLLLLAIVRLALKMFIRPHVETQYGQMMAHGEYIDPSQWQHQAIDQSQQQIAMPQPGPWQQQPPQPQPQQYTPMPSPLPQQPAAPMQPSQQGVPVSQQPMLGAQPQQPPQTGVPQETPAPQQYPPQQ